VNLKVFRQVKISSEPNLTLKDDPGEHTWIYHSNRVWHGLVFYPVGSACGVRYADDYGYLLVVPIHEMVNGITPTLILVSRICLSKIKNPCRACALRLIMEVLEPPFRGYYKRYRCVVGNVI